MELRKQHEKTGAEIIANIKSIYDQFKVPPDLRKHMAKVTAVVSIVCDNWEGPKIDKQSTIAAALLHDIGNLVRFDLET